MSSYEILSILPLNYLQNYAFFANIQLFSVSLESPSFLQNVANAKFKHRDGYGKLRNSHGKVMEKSCAKCVFLL